MLKKGTSKSALMVALATGNVIWGALVVHAEEPSQASIYVRSYDSNSAENGNA